MANPETLDQIEYLKAECAANAGPLAHGYVIEPSREIFCSRCQGLRRVKLRQLSSNSHINEIGIPAGSKTAKGGPYRAPSLYLMICVQCSAHFTAVIFSGPEGEDLATFSSVPGGLASANTPKAIAYYLDQAARAKAVSAKSAAAAMYRVALEQLLFDHGFRKGLLHQKITDLEAAVTEGKAPRWAVHLDMEILHALKQIGNGVLHTNDGDITVQDEVSSEALAMIESAFAELIDLVYEQPAKRAARKQELQALAGKLTPPKKVNP